MPDIQVTDALLEGFLPPKFPALLKQLLYAQDETGAITGEALWFVGKEISGFVRIERATTSDGYDWFWALYFQRESATVAILFPWAQTFNDPTGDPNDRSIAVYVKGEISDQGINELIMEMIKQMHVYGNQYRVKERYLDSPIRIPVKQLTNLQKIWLNVKHFFGQ